jgi:hypothetical protein
MKTILVTILTCYCISATAQSYRDRTWYFGGIQQMHGNYSGISPVYSADSYHLTNLPTVRGEFFGQNNWYRVDLSGFFYWVLSLSSKNNGLINAANVVTTTDKSLFLVQDRVGWEFMSTKLKDDRNGGIGWQVGARRFGVDNWDYDDGNYYMLDNGPYHNESTFGSTLSFGLNYNYFGSIGNHLDFRAGFAINGLAGIYKFGGMAYPEVQLIAHVWRVGIFAKAAYEYTYLYAPTRGLKESSKVKNDDPAKNSGMIHGFRYEIGLGIDLNFKR